MEHYIATFYMKSGNHFSVHCKTLKFTTNASGGKGIEMVSMDDACEERLLVASIDLDQVEAITYHTPRE